MGLFSSSIPSLVSHCSLRCRGFAHFILVALTASFCSLTFSLVPIDFIRMSPFSALLAKFHLDFCLPDHLPGYLQSFTLSPIFSKMFSQLCFKMIVFLNITFSEVALLKSRKPENLKILYSKKKIPCHLTDGDILGSK